MKSKVRSTKINETMMFVNAFPSLTNNLHKEMKPARPQLGVFFEISCT